MANKITDEQELARYFHVSTEQLHEMMLDRFMGTGYHFVYNNDPITGVSIKYQVLDNDKEQYKVLPNGVTQVPVKRIKLDRETDLITIELWDGNKRYLQHHSQIFERDGMEIKEVIGQSLRTLKEKFIDRSHKHTF